ncbi:helicase associated domain-containing protein [Streptomyces sp. NPDC051577]|uniref:helicase associated domain-containing protein n=1 Tax=Streptomyces sp. NPDC051577 TaxID=3155166 RepID=UPI00343658B8
MLKSGDIVLRPHQEEAVEAIVRGLDIPPGKRIPEAGLRASGTGKDGRAFQKGLEALAQYVAREGRLPGRSIVQVLADGTEHRTGVWLANQRQRRDRLDTGQSTALAALGVQWAQPDV